jgi:hypothetical protein
MSFAKLTRLAERLVLSALLTLKVENSLICLAGTRMSTVAMTEGQFTLPLKTLIRNKASRYRRLE